MPEPLEPGVNGAVHVQQVTPGMATRAGRRRPERGARPARCRCAAEPFLQLGARAQSRRRQASVPNQCAHAPRISAPERLDPVGVVRRSRLERSSAHAPDRSSSELATSRRSHQRRAVRGGSDAKATTCGVLLGGTELAGSSQPPRKPGWTNLLRNYTENSPALPSLVAEYRVRSNTGLWTRALRALFLATARTPRVADGRSRRRAGC
jgi:hypothetical protein